MEATTGTQNHYSLIKHQLTALCIQVINSLRRIGKFVNVQVNEIIAGSSHFGYRSKVILRWFAVFSLNR
jgi:hypothetical protein